MARSCGMRYDRRTTLYLRTGEFVVTKLRSKLEMNLLLELTLISRRADNMNRFVGPLAKEASHESKRGSRHSFK